MIRLNILPKSFSCAIIVIQGIICFGNLRESVTLNLKKVHKPLYRSFFSFLFQDAEANNEKTILNGDNTSIDTLHFNETMNKNE